MTKALARAVYLAITGVLLTVVLPPVVIAADLRAFEAPWILALFGVKGIATFVALWAGAAWFLLLAARAVRRPVAPWRLIKTRSRWAVALLWVVLTAWVAQWLFLEIPLSRRFDFMPGNVTARERIEQHVPAWEPIPAQIAAGRSADDLYRIHVMAQRVRLSRPAVFEGAPFWQTLMKYTERYGADPRLMLFWAYSNSFWGEARSGSVPFLRNMTAETFRDFVQIHLPGAFIESPLRVWLIESGVLRRLFGGRAGEKLTYALQKATYDVSMEPYETELFSDAFVVLREYKAEFPEIFSAALTDPLVIALRESFLSIEDEVIPQRCEQPYSEPRETAEFYREYGDDIVTFSRALFYKFETDFDFSTRIQSLVARYLEECFTKALGTATWGLISREQQLVLMAMLGDIYMPNIGQLGSNLYAATELQCTPLQFVIDEARQNVPALLDTTHVWRPQAHEVLWSGAGSRLRLFSEVWAAVTGRALNGLNPTDSIVEAEQTVQRALQ